MTKADLIEKVAQRSSCSQAQSSRILDAALSEIQATLGKGDSISFTGFGSFSVSQRSARRARNPQTGQEMHIAATKVARFRPGKGLRQLVSGK